MSGIDYILDNEVFILELEKKLLDKYRADQENVQNLTQLVNTYRKKGDLTLTKEYTIKVLTLEPNHKLANWMKNILEESSFEPYSPVEEIIPAPFHIIQNFLPEDSLVQLEDIIQQNSTFFNKTTVEYQNKNIVHQDTRKSKVLHKKHFQSFSDYFQKQLKNVIRSVAKQLNVQLIDNKKPELALTMHLDGDFFKIHSDIIADKAGSSRKLTYVFYYHTQPKGFSGGDLLLFDSSSDGKAHDLNYTKIAPVRNSIVFFPSQYFHKVTPIKLATDDYLQGRYTINGWFHG